MNLAQQRLSKLSKWIAASSASRAAPVFDTINVGPYAVVVPTELEAAPGQDFDANALPLFVPASQCVGLALATTDSTAPANQPSAGERLLSLIWRVQAGQLPPVVIIGLDDPDEAIQAAMDRAGAGGVDMTALPVLCAPLWALPPGDRAAVATKLPFLPQDIRH